MKKFFLIFISILFVILSSFTFVKAFISQDVHQVNQQVTQAQAQIQAQDKGNFSTWCHDFTTNISLGDYTVEVVNLQTALSKEGVLDSSYINGSFNTATYNGVVAFQEKYKSEILTPSKLKYGTGKVGTATKTKLNKIFSCNLISKCAPSWTCSDWGNCGSGKQTRKCSDVKNCNLNFGKPLETKACSLPAVKIYGNNNHGSISINSGDSINISWTATNAIFCSATGNWSGGKNITGSESAGALISPKVYNISCRDAFGKIATDTLTVNVVSQLVSIKANGANNTTIASGKSANLSWTATGVKSCFASGDWSGDKNLTGSESTGYLTYARKYIYGITCSGNSGNISDVAIVNVTAPSVSIKANGVAKNTTVVSGKPVSLSWTTTGVVSCTALGNWSGSKSVSGSESTGNIYANSFYVLNCLDNNGNNIGDSVLVKVK